MNTTEMKLSPEELKIKFCFYYEEYLATQHKVQSLKNLLSKLNMKLCDTAADIYELTDSNVIWNFDEVYKICK